MLSLRGKLAMTQATLSTQTGKSKGKVESQMLVFKDAEQEDDVSMNNSSDDESEEEIKEIPIGVANKRAKNTGEEADSYGDYGLEGLDDSMSEDEEDKKIKEKRVKNEEEESEDYGDESDYDEEMVDPSEELAKRDKLGDSSEDIDIDESESL